MRENHPVNIQAPDNCRSVYEATMVEICGLIATIGLRTILFGI